MEWINWFYHDDGTPRTMYKTISKQAEIILSDTPDGCEAKIVLKGDEIRHEKTFEIKIDNKITDTAIQAWAETKAICYLEDLANLARRTADKLKNQ